MLYLIDYQVFISIFINIHYPELRLKTKWQTFNFKIVHT